MARAALADMPRRHLVSAADVPRKPRGRSYRRARAPGACRLAGPGRAQPRSWNPSTFSTTCRAPPGRDHAGGASCPTRSSTSACARPAPPRSTGGRAREVAADGPLASARTAPIGHRLRRPRVRRPFPPISTIAVLRQHGLRRGRRGRARQTDAIAPFDHLEGLLLGSPGREACAAGAQLISRAGWRQHGARPSQSLAQPSTAGVEGRALGFTSAIAPAGSAAVVHACSASAWSPPAPGLARVPRAACGEIFTGRRQTPVAARPTTRRRLQGRARRRRSRRRRPADRASGASPGHSGSARGRTAVGAQRAEVSTSSPGCAGKNQHASSGLRARPRRPAGRPSPPGPTARRPPRRAPGSRGKVVGGGGGGGGGLRRGRWSISLLFGPGPSGSRASGTEENGGAWGARHAAPRSGGMRHASRRRGMQAAVEPSKLIKSGIRELNDGAEMAPFFGPVPPGRPRPTARKAAPRLPPASASARRTSSIVAAGFTSFTVTSRATWSRPRSSACTRRGACSAADRCRRRHGGAPPGS